MRPEEDDGLLGRPAAKGGKAIQSAGCEVVPQRRFHFGSRRGMWGRLVNQVSQFRDDPGQL